MLVVFTPPAIEPGDPPVNIRKIIMKSVLSLSAPTSTVLNPAVRQVTDWKKELTSFSERVKSRSVLFHSSAANTAIPPAMKTAR